MSFSIKDLTNTFATSLPFTTRHVEKIDAKKYLIGKVIDVDGVKGLVKDVKGNYLLLDDMFRKSDTIVKFDNEKIIILADMNDDSRPLKYEWERRCNEDELAMCMGCFHNKRSKERMLHFVMCSKDNPRKVVDENGNASCPDEKQMTCNDCGIYKGDLEGVPAISHRECLERGGKVTCAYFAISKL